jgi:ectoine hydroxylase-related dioxygenase (phytanoyl-CoA dioxygenase family)
LPWHRDLTVAVREHRPANDQFTKPTTKVGVPHAEAPAEVLEGMLTARIHFDPATDENGVLYVVPGSHRLGRAMPADDAGAVAVTAAAGDVLLMRPLVTHCSGSSAAGTTMHRRVLHLEFAASRAPPAGYHWYEFVPGGGWRSGAIRNSFHQVLGDARGAFVRAPARRSARRR